MERQILNFVIDKAKNPWWYQDVAFHLVLQIP